MTPPQSIAHYRITTKLGEGGMGAVYRATDTKLNRDVAIKVLPPAFADDAARMQRFEREAQVLASLNHPNIAAIYGVEQGAIVMELIEGEELKGPLPIDTVISYARQLAAALEAAHEKGIVHRDLKPANIKITPDGTLKVLDFGLAKATEASTATTSVSPTMSPTLSLAMTQAGMILGTAAYMAPEQARGKPVDKRADIWAFGVVLFEALTGAPLFAGGETLTDTIAAVVTREPDWSALPPDTPPHLRRIIQRCLRKDPKQRLRDIGDARIALDEPDALSAAPAASAPSRTWPVAAAVLALAAGVAGFGWWRAAQPIPAAAPIHLRADIGQDIYVGAQNPVLISPDGSRLLFTVMPKPDQYVLATRLLSETKVTLLPGTEDAAQYFFMSDGQSVGFFRDRDLKVVEISSGAMSQAGSNVLPLWCDSAAAQKSICANIYTGGVYYSQGRLDLRPLPLKLGGSPYWPQFLPGEKQALITVAHGVSDFDNAEIVGINIATAQARSVHRGGYYGRYLANGYFTFLNRGALFAAPFDPESMRMLIPPVSVVDDVGGNRLGFGQYDVSRNGTLVYVPVSGASPTSPFTWLDSSSKTTQILPAADYYAPSISPDGRRIAYTSRQSGDPDIWVYDMTRQTATQLTFHAKRPILEVAWAPDSKHLVFGADSLSGDDIKEGAGLFWARADAAAPPVRLLSDARLSLRPQSISGDGHTLIYAVSPGGFPDLLTLPLDLTDPEHPKPGPPQPYLTTPNLVEVDGALSPDGKWMAYASSESTREEVFVRPYPLGSNGGGKFHISSDGGKFPRWSPNGHELFFLGGDDHIMVTDYHVKGEDFETTKPRHWCETPIQVTGVIRSFDMAPDGKRFVIQPQVGVSKAPARVSIVFNFFEELRRKVPVGK
jgi:predicted Ser/Thr protein kinase